MPPVPVHRDAPIAPVVPKTDAEGTSQNPPPTRTTPAYAPATTTQDSSSNPPPPQPGARPVPPTAAAPTYNASSPAPPQPGPTATFITTETRQAAGPPMQFTQAPPLDSGLAGRSTATSTTASKSGPTTINYGDATAQSSFEHPPGYVQAPDNSSYGVGGGTGTSMGQDGEEGGVGAAAWNILNKAGEALKKGEEAAWRAVRNK